MEQLKLGRLRHDSRGSYVSYVVFVARRSSPGPELVFPDCGVGAPDCASLFEPNLVVVVLEPTTIACSCWAWSGRAVTFNEN